MKNKIKSLLSILGCTLSLSIFAADDITVHDIEGNPFGEVKKIEGTTKTGMALYLDGKTLYAGINHYLHIYDVTEPMNPKELGKIGGLGNVRQMVAQNGIVFIAARETGLWIIDAKNPCQPKVITRFDTIELATGIDVAGDILFVGQRNNGVEFIDISDLKNPAHIKLHKTSESQSVYYRDGYLYSGDWGMGEITVIDASDMSKIKTVSITKLDGFGDGIDLSGKYIFASTGHHSKLGKKSKEEAFGMGHGVEIFDVSDPKSLKKVSSIKFPKCYALGDDYWTPRACGNTVFCTDTFNGAFALDISNIKEPKIIGRITTKPNRKGYASTPISSIAVGDGVIYLTALKYGLFAVECKSAKYIPRQKGKMPINKEYRENYPTNEEKFVVWKPEMRAQVRSVAMNGNIAYAACANYGLAVLRISKNKIKQIGRIPVPFAGDVVVKDGKLFVAEGADGLAVYKIKSPTKLEELGRINKFFPESTLSLWVWVPDGNFAVTSSRNGKILIFIDIRDLKNMKVAYAEGGCPGWDKYLANNVVGGKYLGMSFANKCFTWYDISGDKPVKTLESRINKPSVPNGCCVYKNDKLLYTCRGRVTILDPNQKENADGTPWSGVKYEKTGWSMPTWDGGNKVYFTSRINKTITCHDYTDEKKPKPIWKETIIGNPETPVFWNGIPIFPVGYQGLIMYKQQ